MLRTRLGSAATIRAIDYGEPTNVNGVRVSLHPAGHILGSAQVRVEHRGEVWVASGDYKTQPDPTCTPFELVRCHTFITESTFGLPIYRWPPDPAVFDAIRAWCTAHGHPLTGPSWEIYGHWKPEWNADPSAIRTDVFYQVAPAPHSTG